jgi:hypothetical protein
MWNILVLTDRRKGQTAILQNGVLSRGTGVRVHIVSVCVHCTVVPPDT